jgi:hypothetical protein
MKTELMKVKTKDNQEGWEFTTPLPESIEEAIAVYGVEITYDVFLAGLNVKIQAVARSMFNDGKTREEVEASLRDFKPGSGMKKSFKDSAFELMIDPTIQAQMDAEPALRAEVKELFSKNQFGAIVDKLSPLSK